MSAWSQMVEARKHFFSLWVACGFVAFACSVAALSGVEALRWFAVIFGLLAAHAMTAWSALNQLSRLQAALDMKHLHVQAKPSLASTMPTHQRGEVRFKAGDRFTFVAVDGSVLTLAFDRETAFRIV